MEDPHPHFMPEWTRAVIGIYKKRLFLFEPVAYSIDEAKKKINQKYNLKWGSTNCCLVGEAHFKSNCYFESCRACSQFSLHQSQQALLSVEHLYNFKKLLYEHLREQHPKIWQSWESKK